MKKSHFAGVLFAFFITNLMQSANAILIEWTINDGTFADGGTATGSFLWDTDLSQVNSWNLSVSGGDTGTYPNLIYSNSSSGAFVGTNIVYFDDDSSTRQLRFALDNLSSLDTAVPSLPLSSSFSAQAGNGLLECYNCSPFRTNAIEVTPYLSGSVVPVPAAVWLFGSGLIGLVGVARRKKAA